MAEKPQVIDFNLGSYESSRDNFAPLQSFAPRYDLSADYGANAENFTKALAKQNYFIGQIVPFINRLIFRNFDVTNTQSILFSKSGDWYDNDDIVHLKADVRTSSSQYQGYDNATKVITDGVFSKDFTKEIAGMHEVDKGLDKRLNQAEATLVTLGLQVDQNTKNLKSDEDRLKQLEYFTQRYVMQGYELLIEHDMDGMPSVLVKRYDNAIDTEKDGLGTSNEFGGTVARVVPSQVQYVSQSALTVKMSIDERMSGTMFRRGNDWYVIDGIKTMKITLAK